MKSSLLTLGKKIDILKLRFFGNLNKAYFLSRWDGGKL